MLDKIYEKLKTIFLPMEFKIYKTAPTTFGLFLKTNGTDFNLEEFISEFKDKLNEFKILGPKDILMEIKITAGMSYGDETDLYNKALHALYDSNSGGKFTQYSDSIKDKRKWEENVFKALDKNEKNYKVIPFFQSIVDSDGKIVTCEALVRIKIGANYYAPGFFLDYIEDNLNLMKRLTIEMIESVTNIMKEYDINFSINLTIKDLTDRSIIDYILHCLKVNNIEPKRLSIEILEQKIKNDDDEIKMMKGIKILKKSNINIYIDDFGTGESTFKRIRDISPEGIKIDGSLIRDIMNNDVNRKVVEGIVAFCHTIGAKVVAEFVENKEINDVLKTLGIDLYQGYFHYKPVEKLQIK